uniref:Ig-like domain-containing protein n=1 Tax=Corvus moneduloides TaxID=1196302 RepID=A0A8U7NRR0_CORMO
MRILEPRKDQRCGYTSHTENCARTKTCSSLPLLITQIVPGPGLPQFVVLGYLDRTPLEQGQNRGLSPWEQGRIPVPEGEAAARTDRDSHPFSLPRWAEERGKGDKVNTGKLRQLGRSPIPPHPRLCTLQQECSCDLSNRSICGSFPQGCDGWDFMSFSLGSGSFVAADGTAQITKRLWESDGITAQYLKNALEHTCVEVLKKHIRYRQEALECKGGGGIPMGMGNLGIFYPSTIAVSWMKGDEIRDQETEWGGIVPNSDGTFHTWARMEARPEEWEQYRCRVEHPGMPEPGIFTWGEAGRTGAGWMEEDQVGWMEQDCGRIRLPLSMDSTGSFIPWDGDRHRVTP